MTAVLAAAGVAAGTAVQAATGFGFSMLAAPLAFAALGPRDAIGLLIITGTIVNLLTLTTERRRPRPLGRQVAVLMGWALPGALLGVVALRSLSAAALQVALTVGVLTTLIVRWRGTRSTPHAPGWMGPVAGFASGALTTSTSTSGPPLITYLLGQGHEPGRVRDTMTVCFLVLSPIGTAALVVTGTDAWPDPVLAAVLVPVVVLAHLVGRRLFARLAHGGRYEAVLTGLLLVALVVGLAGVLTS